MKKPEKKVRRNYRKNVNNKKERQENTIIQQFKEHEVREVVTEVMVKEFETAVEKVLQDLEPLLQTLVDVYLGEEVKKEDKKVEETKIKGEEE